MATFYCDGVGLALADTSRTYHVGRMEGADLPINDPSISRRHCTLAHDAAADAWRITDLDSAQGTTVDGARLGPHAPCALWRGARVQLGQLARVYVFDSPPPPPAAPTPPLPAPEPAPRPVRPAPAGPALGATSAAPTCAEAEPPPDLTGVSERKTGTACKWDVLKGWGFVKPDDGGADVFAHRNDLKFEPAFPGATVKSLRSGEHVVFRLAYKDGRPQAIEITGPDGASVIGQPPPPPPAADDGAAAAADGAGGRGGRGGRGRGRGLSFFSVELPGQTPAPGPDRTERPRGGVAPVGFVPRQARKAAAVGTSAAAAGALRAVATVERAQAEMQ
jgi:cold shock CspA family protein